MCSRESKENFALAVGNFGKQWKFLETPARNQAGEISRVVLEGAQRTGSVRQGLLLGGLRLQRESQKLCPVRTGNLRNSAYTDFEENVS